MFVITNEGFNIYSYILSSTTANRMEGAFSPSRQATLGAPMLEEETSPLPATPRLAPIDAPWSLLASLEHF